MKKTIIVLLGLTMTIGLAGRALAANELPNNQLHLSNPHQNFTSNTAACATCHSTHKAVGPKLLSGSNTYDSCTNCHNGTESVYDVLDGKIYNTTDTTSVDANAGLFGGGDVSGNAAHSKHVANNGTGIDMATVNSSGMGAEGKYSGSDVFTCANCHDPHKKLSDTTGTGTYNARLLKAAPRMVAKEDSKATLLYQTGTPGTLKINASSNPGSVLSGSFGGFMNTYPQQPKLYSWDAVNGYVEINAANWTFDAANGVFSPVSPYLFNQAMTYKASFWPKAPLVNITYDNWRANTGGATLTGMETPHYVTAINNWCGTCHNDYALTNSNGAVGDYKAAYRHPVGTVDAAAMVNSAKSGTFVPTLGGTALTGGAGAINLPLTDTTNQITCLTCHFAHGSRAISSIAGDAVNGFNDAGGAVNNNGKLLRYDNRDTCESCHKK